MYPKNRQNTRQKTTKPTPLFPLFPPSRVNSDPRRGATALTTTRPDFFAASSITASPAGPRARITARPPAAPRPRDARAPPPAAALLHRSRTRSHASAELAPLPITIRHATEAARNRTQLLICTPLDHGPQAIETRIHRARCRPFTDPFVASRPTAAVVARRHPRAARRARRDRRHDLHPREPPRPLSVTICPHPRSRRTYRRRRRGRP